MYLTKDVDPELYEDWIHPEVLGVKRRYLLNPENSAKNFALRAYIVEPGGHTAFDVHEHEHGVYILSGRLSVIIGDKELLLQPGDVIHIAAKEPHQFTNNGSKAAKFLCIRDFPNA